MKNYFLKFTCIFLLTFGCKSLIAQSKQIDSLKQLLKTAKEDTNRVNSLNELSKKLNQVGNSDSSLLIANEAKALAEKIKFKKGIGLAYHNTGNVYNNQANYKEAIKNYQEAIKIFEKTDYKPGIANAYSNIGMGFYYQDNYQEALKNHTEALKIRQVIHDKTGIGASYNNIGNAYYAQGIYPEALKNHLAALKIREENNDQSGIANSYDNIGNVYADQGNFKEAIKNYLAALNIREELGNQKGIASSHINIGSIYYDKGNYAEALKNYKAALKIQEELEDIQGLGYSYTGIGLVYKDQGNYEEALKNQLASLKIWEELNDQGSMALCFVNIGATYNALKNYTTAEEYLLKALKLAKELDYLEAVRSSYQSLTETYSKTKQHEKALACYKSYISIKDSLLNEESTRKTVQTQMEYEFDKKETATKLEQEKKDIVTGEEKRKQQIVIIAVSVGLLLVLLLAGVIFRSLRLNKRKNKIIEHQKHIVEEKHKEITDSINYAERIQRSFLATKELLDENLKDYFVFFKPKDIVSGDFYWAGKLQNDQFAFVTADSTGHGVPGAIMSILNISSLEKAVESGINEPAEILNHARLNIIQRLKKDGSNEGGKDGMDCSLAVYDFKNKKLIVAAANNPIWIMRKNESGITEAIEIKVDKMPVGKHDKQAISFTQKKFDLLKDDVVYSLTDGFPDQFGGDKGKKFMSKNLRNLLATNAHLPMNEQKKLLQQTLKEWIGNLEQIDDITIIGIRI